MVQSIYQKNGALNALDESAPLSDWVKEVQYLLNHSEPSFPSIADWRQNAAQYINLYQKYLFTELKSKILIYECLYIGHHPSYLRICVEAFLEVEAKVILATPKIMIAQKHLGERLFFSCKV